MKLWENQYIVSKRWLPNLSKLFNFVSHFEKKLKLAKNIEISIFYNPLAKLVFEKALNIAKTNSKLFKLIIFV